MIALVSEYECPKDEEVTLRGEVRNKRVLETRIKKDSMCVFQLMRDGMITEVIAFPEVFAESHDSIEEGAVVYIRGQISTTKGSQQFIAKGITPVE
jgi:DNA polymerase III alpha subunit